MTNAPRRVVIVGGGFGGIYAARGLRRASVEVRLIDRRNFNVFSPMLYQAATGAVGASEISRPLRDMLRRQRNVRVILGEAIGIDADRREGGAVMRVSHVPCCRAGPAARWRREESPRARQSRRLVRADRR
jgi:NADPH-dependent 2,4-dienoyl-CoA reductase/sulfur reductase-like enzyme